MKKDIFEKKELQTVSKHNILENHLEPWVKIFSSEKQAKWVKKLYYVDAFAGAGRYSTGEEGSPVIGSRILSEYHRTGIRSCCVCIERGEDRATRLSNELKPFRDKVETRIYQGEFNDKIGEVLKEIGTAPGFFLIDPEGFSGMDFASIEKILELPHKEALINFQYNAIQRWLGVKKVEKPISGLFGTGEYVDIVRKELCPAEKERRLIDLYKSQLREKGYFVWHFRNRFPTKNRTFYYLVYATKNIYGFKIMKDVIFAEQSRRYFRPNLFKEIEFETFRKELLERYKTQRVLYNEVLGYVLQETDYLAKDLDSVLKDGHVKKEPNKRDKHNPWLVFANPYDTGAFRTLRVQESTGTATLLQVPVRYPRVLYDDNGEVKRIGDGSIITRFAKTPVPLEPTDVICPHFLELKWAYGCPFDCSWCYLKGTFRFRPEKTKPAFKPLAKVKLHTEAFLSSDSRPEILNTGEIADSLMGENGGLPFSRFIIQLTESQNKHKVLFVTKSTNISHLLAIPSHDQAIVSFSLNADEPAVRWEKGAAPVSERIEAAAKLAESGYEVRIRIDPMVPVPNWQDQYSRLIDGIFGRFVPERITLGSLRGLQSTINSTSDKSWTEFLKENSNWGKKIDFTTRLKMYSETIEHLRKDYDYERIGLCKETMAMWNKLGMDYERIKCNCIW